MSTTVVDPEVSILRNMVKESALTVFSTMVGCNLEPGEASRKPAFQQLNDVRSSISLSGGFKAIFVISLDREVAFAAAQAFLGEKPNDINADVIDLVGELANMIGGRTKEKLNMPDCKLGLPCTGVPAENVGQSHQIECIEHLPFSTPWGNLTIEVGTAVA